jgi:hypothetical protein
MSNSPAEEERLDNDQTDELPILLETADLGTDEDDAATAERTGEHTTHLVALSPAEDRTAGERELEQRIKQIASLERDLARLSARWLDTERYLTEKDAVIGDLNRALAKARVENSERRATEQRLATELQDREAQFNKLLDELDKLRQESAASAREVEQQRASRHAAVEELALARLELTQHSSPVNEDDEIRALREELATLTVYIDNRHASWVAAEARGSEQQQRIAELERELTQRAERLQRAENLAERENARAVGLREDLVTHSRRAESLAAELAQYRSYPVAQRAAIAKLESELAEAWQAHEKLKQELADARLMLIRRDDVRALHERSSADDTAHVAPVIATVPVASSPGPATEAIVEPREAGAHSGLPATGSDSSAVAVRYGTGLEQEPVPPETKPETAPEPAVAQRESERRPAVETRTEANASRADTARERTTSGNAGGPVPRDERPLSPQADVVTRRGQTLAGHVDPAPQRADPRVSHRVSMDVSSELANTPALICLTSDAPRQYSLTKRVTTIGRSAHCDIQIVTHFVSREHARISIEQQGNVTIEDMDSTNGVFVNSVRVDRQQLRHGDLVTVGETQFRFLESMAH